MGVWTNPVWFAHVAVLVLTGCTQIALAAWVYRRQWDRRGARTFVLMTASGVAWIVAELAGVLATDPGIEVIAYFFGAFFVTTTVAGFVVFASVYSNADYHRHPVVAGSLLAAIVGYAVLAPTNGAHHLLFEPFTPVTEPFPYVQYSRGPAFDLIVLVVSVLALYSVVRMGLYLLSTRRNPRRQLGLLMLGALSIIGLELLSSLGLMPLSRYTYAVYGLLPFYLCTALAVFRFGLLDVKPIARSHVVEGLGDPVLVFDDERNLMDYNRASTAIWPDLADRLGESFTTVCPELADRITVDQAGGPSADDGPDLTAVPGPDGDDGDRTPDQNGDGGDPDTSTPSDPASPADDSPATVVVLSAAGDDRHYSVTVSRIGRPDAGGDPWYAILLRDVTALERSRRKLEAQNERLDQVGSTISHDLRNPIQVAEGSLSLLETDLGDLDVAVGADEELFERTDAIRRALERMDDILEDLLTIAREGKTVEDTEPVALRTVAEEAWETAGTGVATLSVVADVTVQADRSKLLTVLENLFRNAIDHGPADVTVTVGATTDGFFVADDGPGIPESERGTVFEYGYSTREGNTGLGLYIVRTMAESHGWSVRLEHAPDGGAKFVFSTVGAARPAGETADGSA